MLSVADFDHVNGRHEQHARCRQPAISLEEEEEDQHEEQLAPDPLLLLDELRGLHWN